MTAIAVLLTVLVWTNIADRPLLAQQASAVVDPPGIPNAGQQRAQIRDAVQDLRKELQKMNKMMADGKLKVEVSNIAELKTDNDNDD